MAAPSKANVEVWRQEVQLTLDLFAMPEREDAFAPSQPAVVPFERRPTLEPVPATKDDSCPIKRGRGRPKGAKLEAPGNTFEWKADDIVEIRRQVLERSLESLASLGPVARKEVEDWVASNDIAPFSFVVCCSAAGLCPTTLRDLLRAEVPQASWQHSDDTPPCS